MSRHRIWRIDVPIRVQMREDGSASLRISDDAELARFVEHGDSLLRDIPVQHLWLMDAGKYIGALAKRPALLAAMKSLRLDDLADQGAAVLATLDLHSLRELEVQKLEPRVDEVYSPQQGTLSDWLSGLVGMVTPAGVRALASSAWLPHLERLTVNRNYVGAVGMEALVRASLDGLRELALPGCLLDDGAAEALAALPRLSNLRRLDLGGDAPLGEGHLDETVENWARNLIGASGAASLAGASWLPAVEIMSLRNNQIGTDGALALAGMPAPGPVDLDLRGNGIEEPGAGALGSAAWSRLRRIGLTGNKLYDHRDQAGAHYFTGRPLEAREIAERVRVRRGVEVY